MKGRFGFLSRLFAGLFLAILFGPLPVSAQNILLLEGPIQRVRPALNQMVVMGVTVNVPPGTPITTPTTNLTDLAGGENPLSLLIGNSLPGRSPTPGFIGGTAIINGRVNAAGVATATDVFVEPAENVMLGSISTSTCTNVRCNGAGNLLELNGIEMRRLTDPRLKAGPVLNDFGFNANLTGANLVGNAASAEGYFARGRFHYFLLQIAGAPLSNPTITEVSITRAQCRDDAGGIQLDVLGSVHTPRTGIVTISDGGATVFGTANAVAAAPGFGSYDFRLRDQPAFTTCPESVAAEFNGATATSTVDIIP